MTIFSCASHRYCFSKNNEGQKHLVPAPHLCLLLLVTFLPNLTATHSTDKLESLFLKLFACCSFTASCLLDHILSIFPAPDMDER